MVKRNLFFFLFIFCLSSCGLFQRRFTYLNSNEEIPHEKSESRLKHLSSLSHSYLNAPDIQRIHLSKKSRKYLAGTYKRIAKSNELIFAQDNKVHFYFIKEETPFIFSLPHGHIFLSTGLLLKYLKSESLLVSSLVFEYIKSFKGIYRNKEVIPVGHLSTSHLIFLTRIGLDMKMKINQWAYTAMKRARYDAEALLRWIQTQNKNALDFSTLNGVGSSIVKEEFLFKSFSWKKRKRDHSEDDVQLENSSREFYHLINEMRKKIQSSSYPI